jgi:imidazolonepropionase-like amidohydrolase
MDRSLVLAGGTVHASPDDEPIRDAVVLVERGIITAVGPTGSVTTPPDAPRIECPGRTITAGFWNSHVHFFERKWANAAEIPVPELARQLEAMLARYGFTSVFDTGSEWRNTSVICNRIETGEVAGPRIRSTGEGIVPPGGLPPDLVLHMMGAMKFDAPEAADGPQAAAAARRLLDAGVDGIKLFASSPRSPALPQSAFEAAAAEAHRAGKPVFAHPNSGADVLTAVRGGVDIVAHTTPHSGAWTEEILSEMQARRVALTPTLTLWRYYARHDRLSLQEQVVETELGQLRAWIAHDGEVLFGTDLGAVEYDPTEEYRLMSAAGMSFRQILASLTTAPATRFGDAARLGRIAPGFEADLVVLGGDPAADIRALAAVERTIRAGLQIHPLAGPSAGC